MPQTSNTNRPAGDFPSPSPDERTAGFGINPARRLSICLINPCFEPSFWSYDYSLELLPDDVRCHMVTGALPALAGLLDRRHDIVIIDENVETIDFDALGRFDVIGVTGMIVQRRRMKEILLALQKQPACVVVGGPLASCDEAFFEGLCEVRFIGEADETWPNFIEDMAVGRELKQRYVQAERTDMGRVPIGRYDLIKTSRYRIATVQFSRGCPYRCEFCDIIIMFGRRPRVKRPEQVIAELEEIHKAGFNTCFIVDDNFIGNKKEAAGLLRALVEWQQQHDYPLAFATEATVNLADEPELLELMWQANFTNVFIGIETPNIAALKETKKSQNLRGDSLQAKLKRIYDAGIVVSCGLIVGFDEDTDAIFDSQYNFIHETGIGLAFISILAPIPTTPLYDRLFTEERLYPSDTSCAFLPKQLTREELKRGYLDLMNRVYQPDAFFSRIFRSYRENPSFRKRRAAIEKHRRAQQGSRLPLAASMIMVRLFVTMARHGYLRQLVPAYWHAWRDNHAQGADRMPFNNFVNLCIQHWHFYRITHGPLRSTFLDTAETS